jgi:hypothetical protein
VKKPRQLGDTALRGLVPGPAGLLLVLLVSLAGCGTYRWEKPGAGAAEFRRDSETCQQQAPPGQWDSCMKGLGWRYSDKLW